MLLRLLLVTTHTQYTSIYLSSSFHCLAYTFVYLTMPSKSPSDKRMQEEMSHRKEEMELFARFREIAMTKFQQLARQSEETGTKLKMGEEEQKIIYRNNGVGLKEGVAAGIVSFVVLRRGPIYMARYLQKRAMQQQQAQAQAQQHAATGAKPPPQSGMNATKVPPPRGDGSYQLSTPNVANANNPFQRVQNPEGPPLAKGSIVRRSIWFAFDGLLSLMVAASVSMTYTDADKFRNELVEIPLVPGRSLVSDALCDDITAELLKVQQEDLPVYLRLQQTLKHHADSDSETSQNLSASYLESIKHFSEHCQRRRAMEKSIRQMDGLDKRDPVEIPSPGVPRDGPRLVTLTDGHQIEVNNEDVDFDALGQGEDQWVSDFVTDQENADNQKKW
jgi:hypothetical protein